MTFLLPPGSLWVNNGKPNFLLNAAQTVLELNLKILPVILENKCYEHKVWKFVKIILLPKLGKFGEIIIVRFY